MAMRSTTHLKLTWVWPLPSWDNLRILLQHDTYKLTSASPPPRTKKGVQDIADQLQVPNPEVGRSNLVTVATKTTTLPFSPWLKEAVRTKWRNRPTLPPTQRPTLQLTLQPMLPLMLQATSPTMSPTLLAPSSRTPPAMRGRTQELNLHQYKPTVPREVNAYDMKWR
jgi:hypothetical protein